jgi:uncharacterized membrane protein
MTFADWLLALHLLSAFVLVAAITWLTGLMLAGRRITRTSDAVAYARLARVSNPLVGAGAVLALVFGIWLAIDLSAYHPWDGWILAAIVLWVIATAAGGRAGERFGRAVRLARDAVARGEESPSSELVAALRDPQALRLQVVTIVCTALILLDMIYKPGA